MQEMTYDFDELIERADTGSVKYKLIHRNGAVEISDEANLALGKDRVIQMWVADMDFEAPPVVAAALRRRIDHHIYGYTEPEDSFYTAVTDWCARRYNWTIEKEWLMLSPGVIPSLCMLIPRLTAPGDKVLIQRPIYPPFMSSVQGNGREYVSNSLHYDRAHGRYTMDFADLARQAADPDVKLALLCHPHNPSGRVWTPAELTSFADICLENGLKIISDEVHCDLIFDDHTFVPLASLSPEIAQNTVTCMAPSKTFNLAGLKYSHAIIPNPELRQIFKAAQYASGQFRPNAFGIFAAEAVYNEGERWLADVMTYIQANFVFLRDYLARHWPAVKVIEPEGTYLVWVDCRDLGLAQDDLMSRLINEARVQLNDGLSFGPEGEGFIRFNLATPRQVLEEALTRITAIFGPRL